MDKIAEEHLLKEEQEEANIDLVSIKINQQNDAKIFKGNLIKTSKYTSVNFVPKNLVL